jgi:hypothetical protein
MHLDLGGVQIVIINDIDSIFTPVIDFKLHQLDLIIKRSALRTQIATSILIDAHYYNSRVSAWEPVVEVTRIYVDLLLNNILGQVRNLICVRLEEMDEV